ncbi:MAG: hypothetical protein JWO67_1026 [Streptosporangiaceae bacterium]|nr:hypothetical protein [Streptosporangiaceae bacterium]
MSDDAHDGDRVRGFPAFAAGRRGPGGFARSWWGNAWIKALRDTSLDQEPLRQGRRYALAGQVGPITVSPGRIAAPVYGLHDAPYRTVVLVEQLTDAQWGRFLDQMADTAGHIAALLDRDMPGDLVQAAEDAGVPLLPGLGDLEPDCGCPDWGHPCTHAAALCYQASWLLDADPFVLLLMRGRGRAELVAELRRRNALHGEPQTPTLATRALGTPAQGAFARGVPALPPPPPAPDALTSIADVLPGLPPGPGVDPDTLRVLVADAALRARESLTTDRPQPALDVWQDTVRLAATHHDPGLLARLRRSLGHDPDPGGGRTAEDLARAIRAWRYGGPAGLELLEETWRPPRGDARFRGDLARAATVLTRFQAEGGWEGDERPGLKAQVGRNRWTVRELGVQLRYGRDGRWHPYRQEAGRWWPAGPPGRDAAAAITRLLTG